MGHPCLLGWRFGEWLATLLSRGILRLGHLDALGLMSDLLDQRGGRTFLNPIDSRKRQVSIFRSGGSERIQRLVDRRTVSVLASG